MTSVADALHELRVLRAVPRVKPLLTISMADLVLAHPARAGDEVWPIHEQVAIAHLDLGHLDVAEQHIATLEARFSATSTRIRKLRGMQAEARGDFTAAGAIYDALIEANESDVSVLKRKVALLKTSGRPRDAIAALATLLDTYPMDPEAWLELADLYASQSMLQQALHCIEEAILLVPTSHFAHAAYAQTQYALGHRELALKSFCRAVEIVPSYAAGLYGIVQCCAALLLASSAAAADGATADADRKLWRQLSTAAANKIAKRAAGVTVKGQDDSAAVRAARAYLDAATKQ
ncbi:hypothetical protein BC828DRAFT_384428 [Blastocladiella britannica]|nr:hypothetical protein BC828DRAFT_384428 [Blastocladiella britannica]